MQGDEAPSNPPAEPVGSDAPDSGETLELVVHARDLVEEDGRPFLERVSNALEGTIDSLVINLIAGRELSPTGVSVLLKARVQARRQGARFLIRPSNKSVTGYLVGLGLERVLVGGGS